MQQWAAQGVGDCTVGHGGGPVRALLVGVGIDEKLFEIVGDVKTFGRFYMEGFCYGRGSREVR